MKEPKIGKYPTEVFGIPYVEYASMTPAKLKKHFTKQHCPFTDSECTKFRKSNPEIKIGTCSLGECGTKPSPNVVCPTRLRTPEIFRQLKQITFGNSTVRILEEVGMSAGTLDYVLVKCDAGLMWRISA